MLPLVINLLGAPQIVSPQAGALTLPRRQPLAFLAILALHEEGVSRDKLAFFLWPDVAQAVARQRVRRTLAQLRRALGVHKDVVQTTGDYVVLNPAGCRVDVRIFSDLSAQACLADPAGTIDPAEQATALYTGPLLDGFVLEDASEFEQWLYEERERLARLYQQTLGQLVGAYQASGQGERAIFMAERMVGLDPLHEEAHLLLMRLYVANDQRQAALRQYERCVVVLERELGVRPVAEMTAYYEELKSPPAPVVADEWPPHNLPTQLNKLIGREEAVAAICERIGEREVRLLTLTGPGGTGKTRLAQEVAAVLLPEFGDGVFFVDLAPILSPTLVASQVAHGLGMSVGLSEPLLTQLQGFVKGKRLLLVLDNFEQVLPAGKLIGDLLAHAPELTVLVTSRALLQLYGEHEYPVPPLDLPEMSVLLQAHGELEKAKFVAFLRQYPAVALFVERAGARFRLTADNALAVVEICWRLDGLPLAIELAAARSKVLTPQAMLGRIDASEESILVWLKSRNRNRPDRQRTLHNVIGWSYDLLAPDEQALFRRLGIFVSGWTWQAAGAIGDREDIFDMLELLVDHSLIRQETDDEGEMRFSMLATIREYALGQLKQEADYGLVQERVAGHFLALAEMAGPELRGPEQIRWLNVLEREHDNLQATLRWAIDSARVEIALRLVNMLWQFWSFRGYQMEGRVWVGEALALPWPEDDPAIIRIRAKSLQGAGTIAHQHRDYEQVKGFIGEAIALWERTDDQEGLAQGYTLLGTTEYELGDLAMSQGWYERALVVFREMNGVRQIAVCLNNLGRIAHVQNNLAEADRIFSESIGILRRLEDMGSVAVVLNNLGIVAHDEGDSGRAIGLLEESLALRRKVGHKRGEASALLNLGQVWFDTADMVQAKGHYRDSLFLYHQVGDKVGLAFCLEGLAGVAVPEARPEEGAAMFGAAMLLRETGGLAVIQAKDRARHERIEAGLKGCLSEVAYARAVASGRGMGLDRVVALALRE